MAHKILSFAQSLEGMPHIRVRSACLLSIDHNNKFQLEVSQSLSLKQVRKNKDKPGDRTVNPELQIPFTDNICNEQVEQQGEH